MDPQSNQNKNRIILFMSYIWEFALLGLLFKHQEYQFHQQIQLPVQCSIGVREVSREGLYLFDQESASLFAHAAILIFLYVFTFLPLLHFEFFLFLFGLRFAFLFYQHVCLDSSKAVAIFAFLTHLLLYQSLATSLVSGSQVLLDVCLV